MENIDLIFRRSKYKFEAKCDFCHSCCCVEVVEYHPEGFRVICSRCGNILKMISKESLPKQPMIIIPKGTEIIIPNGITGTESLILPHDVVIKGDTNEC